MLVLAASFCLYIVCLCLFHAHPRRTVFEAVKAKASYQKALRLLALGLAVMSLSLFVGQFGFEKGFSFWVGIFVAAGILSLLISALKPAYHVKSGAMAALGGVLAFPGLGLGALL